MIGPPNNGPDVIDPWLDFQQKAFDRIMTSRKARGYVPTPSPPWLNKIIREMPNWYLAGVGLQSTKN